MWENDSCYVYIKIKFNRMIFEILIESNFYKICKFSILNYEL